MTMYGYVHVLAIESVHIAIVHVLMSLSLQQCVFSLRSCVQKQLSIHVNVTVPKRVACLWLVFLCLSPPFLLLYLHSISATFDIP